jgi:hypothetical protein
MLAAKIMRWGGPASILGGLWWLVIWILFLLTHGTGTENLQRRLFGLTWLDYNRFLVIALLLFMVGLVNLGMRQQALSSRLGTVGYGLALSGLAFLILGVTLEFWFMPWGSYPEAVWSTQPAWIGGLMEFIASRVLSVGLILFGIDIVRANVLPRWNGLPLILGLLLLASPFLHMTLYTGGMFGFGWVLLGYVLAGRYEGQDGISIKIYVIIIILGNPRERANDFHHMECSSCN